ncbi:ATP-binding cassette domain-containing protein [Cupriavidus basilensis]
MQVPILRLSNITKRFGQLTANDDISLELRRGEVLALLGENGAGKSTLVSILYWALRGRCRHGGGRRPAFCHPASHARRLPPASAWCTTLADNLGAGQHHARHPAAVALAPGMRAARDRCWRWPSALARPRGRRPGCCELSVGERQRVEIVKALYRGARVLILDEPTAVLTPHESETLFATLAQLIAEGLSVIFYQP